MNKLLEKNLKTLDKMYPGIAKLIEEKKEKLLQEEDVEILTEDNLEGEEILKIRKEGRTLYLAGKRSAHAAAVNQIRALGKIEYSAPVFMIGLGNSFYLEELLKATNRDNVIMIYEPSFTIFYAQIQRIDMAELFGKRIIALVVRGLNDIDIKPMMDDMLKGDRVPILKNFILPNYREFFLEPIHEFEKQLAIMTRDYSCEKGTERRFSNVFVENLFYNADYIRTGYQASQLNAVLPKDVPAIIVSAGPSLNKNIEELKKAKGRAFIVAVDTALKPLLNHGIVPDMYAIIDGKKPLHLVQVEGGEKIPLITTAEAACAVLDYHQGKKFFFREGNPFVDRMYEMNQKKFDFMEAGGSVATMAFSFVSYLNYRRVILVGQDLALTGNKSHADGTFSEVMEEVDTSKNKMVPGNCEELVPSRPDFEHYRLWFENFIERWTKRYEDFHVINATEGGAKIKGTEVMTLSDAIERECHREVDIAACIDKISPVFNEGQQRKILEYLHDTPKEFHQIGVLAKTGLTLYKKLNRLVENGNTDKGAYEKVLVQIKKNGKKMEKNPDYELVSECLTVANQILQMEQYRGYRSFEEECKGIADQGITFMELIIECAEMLEQFSEEIFGKITA